MKQSTISFAFVLFLVTLPSVELLGQNPFAENVRKTKPLTPKQQLETFTLPSGFKISLVASEPDIFKPMNLAFDHRGRLWVTDSTEYPYAAPTDQPGRDSVKILEDTDGDGVYDKTHVFADGLNIPIGIYPTHDGCIVFSIPHIWRMRDLDGDDVADERTILFGPMGYERDTHGMNNGFTRGFDGWLYACHGFNNETRVAGTDGHEISMSSGNTYRMKMDGTRVEQFTWGQVNPFGMAIDPNGNLFTADCHSKPIYQLLRGGYYPSFGKPHDGLGFVPPMMDHLHGSTAIAGVAVLADDRFPQAYQGNLLSGNVMTSRVNRNRVEAIGATLKAIEEPDFVQSSDPWFRPVDVQLGPDGAIYVADFYNRIIGHYEVPLEHPGRDRHRGRIWKIEYVGTPENPVDPAPPFKRLDRLTLQELVDRLSDTNLTARLLALNYLVDNLPQDQVHSAAGLLHAAWDPASDADALVANLWAQHRLGVLSSATLLSASRAENPRLQVHAFRVISELAEIEPSLIEVVVLGLESDAAIVRQAAADVLSQHPQLATIPRVLDAWSHTNERDVLLIQAYKIALKNVLAGDSQWYPNAIQSLTPSQRQRLHSVVLAVPSRASALFLLDEMKQVEESAAILTASHVQLMAQHAPTDRLPELIEIVQTQFPGGLNFQFDVLSSIQRGLIERGDGSNELLQGWGDELAKAYLERADDSSSWLFTALPGKPANENCWANQERVSEDGMQGLFLCSLPAGEQSTGVLTSRPFVVPESLQFYIAGHDGFPDKPIQRRNFVRLIDSDSGAEIVRVFAPRNDTAQQVRWDLKEYAGRRASLEIVDGDSANAYAWLAVGRFSAESLRVPELSPRDRSQAIRNATTLIRSLELHGYAPSLRKIALDTTLDAGIRRDAILAGLGKKRFPAIEALAALMLDSKPSVSWEDDFYDLLETRDATKAHKLLEEAVSSASAKRQLQVALALGGSQDSTPLLIELIDAGRISPRVLKNQLLVQQLAATVKDDSQIQHLLDLVSQLPPRSAELDDLIASKIQDYRQSPGQVSRGIEVFKNHCVVCHQVAGEGAVVGPQLDGIGNRGVERIFEDLLDPNRNVDVAFQTTLVQTDDGATLSGLLRKESETSLTLIDSEGKEQVVPIEAIEERLPSSLSLMPENLVADLPEQDLRDLVRYLQSLAAESTPRP